MDETPVPIPDAQYERLAAMAAARGVSVETLLCGLIDDAARGGGPAPRDADGLPLGVCGATGPERPADD
ncbi:hypothetical protein [Halorubrum sp. SY-15]|jgi:hypothetical protein|uniref:hypothetical protein n=1 Tax=Halorubrum sp. SY-15 TaxID=3402277 RepID=UPI003EB755C6